MSETPKQRVFREPDGTETGLRWLLFGVVFLGLHVYFSVLNDSESILGLYLGLFFIFTAIPELLPSERQYLAGVLRIVAILYAVIALVYLFVIP